MLGRSFSCPLFAALLFEFLLFIGWRTALTCAKQNDLMVQSVVTSVVSSANMILQLTPEESLLFIETRKELVSPNFEFQYSKNVGFNDDLQLFRTQFLGALRKAGWQFSCDPRISRQTNIEGKSLIIELPAYGRKSIPSTDATFTWLKNWVFRDLREMGKETDVLSDYDFLSFFCRICKVKFSGSENKSDLIFGLLDYIEQKLYRIERALESYVTNERKPGKNSKLGELGVRRTMNLLCYKNFFSVLKKLLVERFGLELLLDDKEN